MPPLLEKYFEICRENPEVLVLMQVGGFYEAYGDEEKGSAKTLSRILNIHLTKKSSKLPLSVDNPYMCGLPTHAIQKHLTKLNDERYEVMIYDQDPLDPKKRTLRGTYSHNMRMQFEEEDASSSDQKMFGVVVERYPVRDGRLTQYRYLVAISYVEMNTGRVFLQESDHDDVDRAMDEMRLTYQPEEMLLTLLNFEDNTQNTNTWCRRVYTDQDPWTLCEQIHYFRMAFSIPEHEQDTIVHLGLHRHPLLVESLGRLLRLLRKHDPLLMQKLRIPEFIPSSHVMRFNQDALTELNVLSICDRRRFAVEKKKQVSLLDLLSKKMNVMGRRCLEKRLRSPVWNREELQKRYACLGKVMELPGKTTWDDDMPHWVDVEWYLLRWKRSKLSMRQLGQLLQTYRTISPTLPGVSPEVHEALEVITTEWDVDQMTRCTDLSFLKNLPGQQEFTQGLKKVWDEMVLFTKRYMPDAKIERHENTHVLQLKPRQWKGPHHGFFEVHKTKSYVHVQHPDWMVLTVQYHALEQERDRALEALFRQSSADFLQRFGETLETLNETIARFSCDYPLACFFRNHGYTEPVVESSDKAWIECTEFRHAMMEIIHPDALFVPYSCSLGLQNNPRGMLIYGINSSGKSTMLKSMGLCVWMAQCGLYVPCASMRFSPMDALYTKMGIQDNLFLGHSTFVAEMNELLYILQRATPRSFIMCDELTSGTETQSATGIVVSTLLHFLEKQLCFFFTTHLHTVAKIPEISGHPALRICHFRMDTQTQEILVKNIRLRYDRSLHEGSGDDLYGIEIAKAVGLPASFIQQAFSYRDRISVQVRGAEEKIQVSRYNKRFVLTECFLCGSKDHLHTHHITPQAEFASSKNTVHAKKDGLYNLMALCETCHEHLHHSEK